MPYKLTHKEKEAVSALPSGKRLEHFVKRVADGQEVWSLRNKEGWVVYDAKGQEATPFWPHPDYAAPFATGEWADCEPASIHLKDYIDRWLPGLARDGRVVVVFPTEKDFCSIEPELLLIAIKDEIEACGYDD